MKTSVVLFQDTVSSATEDLSQLSPKVEVPSGFTLVGGCRKFIVLLGDEETVVAIGPPMQGNYYYHKEILSASKLGFSKLEIAGGGQVEFTARVYEGKTVWSAEFSGSSGDFGVFDPIILNESARREIAALMGMKTCFDWRR